MSFSLPEVLVRLRPGAKWKVLDIDDYESIEWNDTSQTKPSKEECDAMQTQLKRERLLEDMRDQRNILLDKSDKYTVIDFPHATEEAKQMWLDYRQALRDLPSLLTINDDNSTNAWVTNQFANTLSSGDGLIISDLPGYFMKGEKAVIKIIGDCNFEDEIRYLDVSGQQTDEANAVHIAAFVGCTYHCG